MLLPIHKNISTSKHAFIHTYEHTRGPPDAKTLYKDRWAGKERRPYLKKVKGVIAQQKRIHNKTYGWKDGLWKNNREKNTYRSKVVDTRVK